MDFEYHGALRDIQTSVHATTTQDDMEPWDMSDFVDLSPDATMDDVDAFPETTGGFHAQPDEPSPSGLMQDATPVEQAPALNTFVGGNKQQEFPGQRRVFGVTEPGTEELQLQIDQLKDIVAQLVEARHPSKPPTSRSAHKRSLESLRADSVLGQMGAPTTPAMRSSNASDILSDLSDDTGLQSTPEDSAIYSRRGSASTTSSNPSRRGQRIPGGYPCTRCELTFDIPSQLRHHERKHMTKDERPFPCRHCGERFLYPKDLSRHNERLHNTERVAATNSSSPTTNTANGSSGTSSSSDEQNFERRHWRRLSTGRHRNRPYSAADLKRKHDFLATRLEDVRNSTIPEMEAVGVKTVGSQFVPRSDQAHYVEILRGMQIQVDLQRETIDNLERKLAKAEADAEAWLEERNTFAKVLQRVPGSLTMRPAMFFKQRSHRTPSLTERAKGWLGAIDKMLSTSKRSSEAEGARVSQALEHIAIALDQLDLSDGKG